MRPLISPAMAYIISPLFYIDGFRIKKATKFDMLLNK